MVKGWNMIKKCVWISPFPNSLTMVKGGGLVDVIGNLLNPPHSPGSGSGSPALKP
jgi:hypothetical protein